MSRRASVTPDQVGLPGGGRRRVAGLRREEVALLAGISVEYYTQLERGNARGASHDVLEAIARVLQLDDTERAHLFDLVGAANARPSRRHPTPQRVRPAVRRVLDTITEAAAFVRNGRLDVLAANRLARALYVDAFDTPGVPNLARFVFLDQRAADFYVKWERIADDAVGSLRAEAGRDPYDPALTELVGELSMRSEPFRIRWAAHGVRAYQTGTQPFRHPLVGRLDLAYEAFELPADTGQTLIVYAAPPDSPAQEALNLLASWASTPDGVPADEVPDQP
jgi:transcriptional regulator with XRE-family HTH domain